jgi:hypothetical protein
VVDFLNVQSLPAALMGGGLFIGIVAAFWSRIRLLAARVISFAIVSVRVEDGISRALVGLCWDPSRFRRSKYGDRLFSSRPDFVIPTGRVQEVGYEEPGGSPLVFWYGWRPLIIRCASDKNNDMNIGRGVIIVTFIRGTFDIEALMNEALKIYNDQRHTGSSSATRYFVSRMHGSRGQMGRFAHPQFGGVPGGPPQPVEQKSSNDRVLAAPDKRILFWNRSDIGQPKTNDPFGALAYPPEVEDALADVRRWLASEAWYKSKRIPWRRGYLCCGSPGSGKTSLVRAVAQENDLPIYSFDLATFGNSEFEENWKIVLNCAPCIALFEDLDAVFDGRTNTTSTDDDAGLTFDCFLQTIGGVQDVSGVLVFVTTNHPEKLDPAVGVIDEATGMASRPGRLDRVIHIGLPDESCRRRIITRILSECYEEIENLVQKTTGLSGAQVTEAAAELALTRYWAERKSNEQKGGAPCPRVSICPGHATCLH